MLVNMMASDDNQKHQNGMGEFLVSDYWWCENLGYTRELFRGNPWSLFGPHSHTL